MSRRTRTRVTASAPAVAASPAQLPESKPKSIRNLILTQLQAGTSRAEITRQLQVYFPASQAAVKAAKHISWYAGRLKKAGVVLPKPAAVAAAE